MQRTPSSQVSPGAGLWRRWQRWRHRGSNGASFEGFVVIVSHGRSGSTVLQHVLDAVPGVCIRGENGGALIHLERTWSTLGRVVGEHGDRPSMTPDSPWYGIALVDEASVLRRMRALVLDDILDPPAGTRITGFKEIRFTSEYFDTFDGLVGHLVFLDRLLPGVRFVINVRDVDATAASGWWRSHPGARDVLTTTRDWLERLPAAVSDRLGRDRAVLVDHDVWSSDPSALEPMLELVGVSLPRAELDALVGAQLTHMDDWTPPPDADGGVGG